MLFFSRLRNRLPKRSAPRPAVAPSPRFRPRLTALEGRALPSTSYAASASDLIADVKAANQHGGANTIVLTAPTTSPYVLSGVNNTKYGNTVLPVIAKGDSLTVVTANGSADPGYGDTLDAGHNGRLFVVAAGGSLTLKNVTLTGGLAIGSGVANGGAVYNLGTLDLNEVMVSGNEAVGNYTAYVGRKQALTSFDAAGGGVWSGGSLTVENQTQIQHNSAVGVGPTGNGYGGGVYVAGGTATISNTTLGFLPGSYGWGNSAVGGQPGPYDANGGYSVWPTTGGGFGGGLYAAGGTVTLTGDVIASNSAGSVQSGGWDGYDDIGYGGGIYVGTSAAVSLDSYTLSETIGNLDGYQDQSGATANIDGTFALL